MNRQNMANNRETSRYIDEYAQQGYYDQYGDPMAQGGYREDFGAGYANGYGAQPGHLRDRYDQYEERYDTPPGYYDTYDRDFFEPYDKEESDFADYDNRDSKRLHALDIARGIFLIISVSTASVITMPPPHWLTHSPWFGVTLYDLIFPVFVLLSGMGFAFAYKNGVKWGVTIRRACVLFAVGMLYNILTYETYTVTSIRITGVLQLYALLTLVLGPAHLVLRNWKAWLVFTGLCAGGYTWFLNMWPEAYCNVDALTYACNPSGFIDTYVFGPTHMWAAGQFGHDPEGLIAAIGALITASAGTTLGHFFVADYAFRRDQQLAGEQETFQAEIQANFGNGAVEEATKSNDTDKNEKDSDLEKAAKKDAANSNEKEKKSKEAVVPAGPRIYMPSIIVLIVLAGGVGLSFIVPAFKRLWTPSFGLLAAVFGLVLVTALWLIFDRFENTLLLKLSYPLISLGRNALLVYFGSHLLFTLLMRYGEIPVQLGNAIAPTHPALAFVAVSVLAWTLLAMILHRAAVYVHA